MLKTAMVLFHYIVEEQVSKGYDSVSSKTSPLLEVSPSGKWELKYVTAFEMNKQTLRGFEIKSKFLL